MSSRIRLISLAVAALVAVPALSACDTRPGAAATIGDAHITTGQLQAEVNTALADPTIQSVVYPAQAPAAQKPAERVAFIRQTLARLIGDDLVEAVAAEHKVTVSPQEVKTQLDDFIQRAGSLQSLQQTAAQQVGVGAAQLTPLIRMTVLQQKLATALTQNLPATQAQLQAQYQKDIDNYDQLQIAQIAVAKAGLAHRILAKVRAHPSTFGDLVDKYSTDVASKQNGGIVGYVPRSQVVGLLGKNAPVTPGTYAVANSSGQYVVLHIIARQRQPLSEVVGQVKASLFQAQAQALLGKAITTEATKLGVHVNPRYGHWDGTTQSVVANKSPVSSSQ